MQFNTRAAMLRGLELRRKLGSWDAVEQLGRPEDTIDLVRPSSDPEPQPGASVRSAE